MFGQLVDYLFGGVPNVEVDDASEEAQLEALRSGVKNDDWTLVNKSQSQYFLCVLCNF